MKRSFVLVFVIFSVLFSQETHLTKLTDKILLGGDLGFTFTSSDYKDVGVGIIVRGVGEYYFFENENHKIGIRAFGGYGVSTGSDNRYNPEGFSTKLYTLALGGTYSFQLSEAIAPYLFLGLKYLRFNPKDTDGNSLPNNAANQYDRDIINLAVEFGLRYKLSDVLYGYGSLVPFNLTNDYIDDRATGSNKDFVITLNFGLMYAFDTPWSTTSEFAELNELPVGIATETAAEKVESAELIEAEKVETDEISQPMEEAETGIDKVDSKMEIESSEEIIPEVKSVDKIEVVPDNTNIIEELSHKLDLGRVYFDFGKTEFGRLEYVELDRLYRIISDNEKSRWMISGYTDNKEPVQVHQSLGVQRAYFVMRYFMSKGLDRDRFEIVVKGEDNPLGDNSTEEGRAKNRRVEVSRIK